jgi:hypothetical protein
MTKVGRSEERQRKDCVRRWVGPNKTMSRPGLWIWIRMGPLLKMSEYFIFNFCKNALFDILSQERKIRPRKFFKITTNADKKKKLYPQKFTYKIFC